MKHENKCKKKGKKVLLALEEKNLAKILEENDKKKLASILGPIEQRENVFWKSLNSEEHVRNKGFKKLSIRFSIDRKIGSIDRNTQNQAKNF